MRVDYLGLEAFVRVAEHGSFQRAAAVLHLSQTALSHRLKKVEADLGTALLIRSNREVSLTPAGHRLLPDARRHLKELAESYAAIRMRGRPEGRSVTFACVPTIAHAWLSPVLQDFAERHADVAVTLHDIPVALIAEKVQAGEAEFGVTVVSAHVRDLRVHELFSRALRPAGARGAPARGTARGRARGPERGDDGADSTQSKNRQLVADALGDTLPHWRFEVQNAAMAIRLVATGAAATILPRSAVEVMPAGVEMRHLADVPASRTIGIVRRRGVPLSDLGAELMAAIEAGLAAVARRSRSDDGAGATRGK